MNPTNRKYFDRQVEWVLARLPQSVLAILKEVPLHVVDQPSKRLLKELGVAEPDELCGYFCGLPYTECSAFTFCSSVPTSVTIFRRGIVSASRDERGKVCRSELREQIRITVLHELAHLHGMDEDEIDKIGYG
ncbi:MAG: metallopeptidase family protein [Planctomycetaceae bacterium]|nr:metallopeptidase family protein [Planctomycetaceae bacterium]